MNRKRDGLFEKKPGSGVWWIRFHDGVGMLHTYEVGEKTRAESILKALRRKMRVLGLLQEGPR